VLVQLGCGEAEHGSGLLPLDEPTSSLDLRHQVDLTNTARRCALNGTTVIAILHDLNRATCFANRIIVLHQGTVAADGAPDRILTSALIERVFDIELTVQTAADGVPFVLPQMVRSWDSARRCG